MKSVMKSIYMKAIAYTVLMCCVGTAVFFISDFVCDYGSFYRFESSYIQSEKIDDPLHNSFQTACRWLNGQIGNETAKKEFEKNHTHYCIKIYDTVFTDSEKDFSPNDYNVPYGFTVVKKSGEYIVEREIGPIFYDNKLPDTDFEIYIKLDDSYAKETEINWLTAKKEASLTIFYVSVLAFISLLILIYLFWVCGLTPEQENIKMLLIDRMYIEITFFLMCLSAFAAVILSITAAAANIQEIPYEITILSSAGSAVMVGITLMFALSITRNMKNKSFLNRLLTFRIIKFFTRLLRRAVLSLSKKSSKIAMLFIFVYTVFVFLCSLIATENFGIFIILIAGGFAAACNIIFKRLDDFDKIRYTVSKIKNGNTECKIETDKISYIILKDIAESVNTIGSGIEKAVEKQMKAERMKSELITNVSHDLKTPLTSIISYSDLLCKEELNPKEANDYAKIIKEKSLRLKNLTSDLFDISKVQSGNETILKEKLNISLLIKQSVGEADEEIKKSGLEFILNIPEEEITVTADGKKLSRVFENLVINAVKYSMKNTRVYIDLKKENGHCIIDMKNISSFPLNFDCEEITERFVRGDMSRSTEGSGLGLAIAKSYTEACGGSFKIITDGDLFKVRIIF